MLSASSPVSAPLTRSSYRESRPRRSCTSTKSKPWPIETRTHLAKKTPAKKRPAKKFPVPSNYTITKREDDGKPTMAMVEVPGVETVPPMKVAATIGLDNIDVEEVLEAVPMNDGRFDYRISFHHCLLTRAELSYMTKSMRYTVLREYKTPIEMVDEDEDGKKVACKRYLILLQNEWMEYIRLIQYYPNAKGLLGPANQRWASDPGPIVPVKVSYSGGTLISWYPY